MSYIPSEKGAQDQAALIQKMKEPSLIARITPLIRTPSADDMIYDLPVFFLVPPEEKYYGVRMMCAPSTLLACFRNGMGYRADIARQDVVTYDPYSYPETPFDAPPMVDKVLSSRYVCRFCPLDFDGRIVKESGLKVAWPVKRNILKKSL